MARRDTSWLKHIGIGGRLFLAFVLISSITLLASALTTNTYLQLRERLLLLKHQDIPWLDAAAKLNDKSRLIVATAPLLMTSDSNFSRLQAMQELSVAIDEMDSLMRSLPDYNSYFRELIVQIHNGLTLLNQSVERSEQIRTELDQQSQLLYPLFQPLISALELKSDYAKEESIAGVINRLYYFSALVEKVRNDSSYNELDYTFLRLEEFGGQIEKLLTKISTTFIAPDILQNIQKLLIIGSRQGKLFLLKNEQLDLFYQQSYLLQNSQDHIQQLAAQINRYTNQTNDSISRSLVSAIASIDLSIRSILLLSLASLVIAGSISWFYVRRNVLQRILELQKNMRAIASAKLDTKINIRGDDEVSSMARDLKHFQHIAIEVKHTNLQLSAEIKERIAAEAQLKAAQNELVQAGKLAALGQLSVGITHEINQPLTAIASHLHTAGRRLEKQQTEQAVMSLDKIRSLLDKVAGITRHLKAFAREAGAELSPVELDGVIRDAADLISNRLKEQRCELIYIPGAKGLAVFAEPIRLEQVLVNLMTNAIDAMENCRTQSLEIQVSDQGEQVQIDVKDSGMGIPENQLSQIFDPFFTKKEVGKGLGLGLSISYNIIQDFGGHIRVQSTEDLGSCFTLILQRAER
ncbi:sensor histidine kinase [Reinekea forsetii]|jgi:two-component system C4-dicarboxylate transport sensor histidine kinase DctB|uniref:C4-dicarboxylate transport sensor protein DctB n=1 Tax=Reinekea forsetii TaxID=1336806 RepID=A0A2K8KXM4_9GAMM|nr:ATP-binding protein [Reinekea forsetii]ATX78321.1 two-component system sensor histidine kinase [Reinekea forsetii]